MKLTKTPIVFIVWFLIVSYVSLFVSEALAEEVRYKWDEANI